MSFYLSCQCPSCGNWSSKEVRNVHSAVFICQRTISDKWGIKKCSGRQKLKNKRLPGLLINHYGPFKSEREAVKMTSHLNNLGITSLVPCFKSGDEL